MGDGRDKFILDFTSTGPGWPRRVRDLPGGTLYWMCCIEVFNNFVSKDNKDPLICTKPVAIYARDLLEGLLATPLRL